MSEINIAELGEGDELRLLRFYRRPPTLFLLQNSLHS